MANANWQPQNDGVFLSGNHELQWKPNLSDAKVSDLRSQLSQVQESPIGIGDMKNLPQGSWVIQSSQDCDGQERLSLLQVNSGESSFCDRGNAVELPANAVKAKFHSLDGLFLVGAETAAHMLEKGRSRPCKGRTRLYVTWVLPCRGGEKFRDEIQDLIQQPLSKPVTKHTGSIHSR